MMKSCIVTFVFLSCVGKSQICTGDKVADVNRIDFEIPLNHDYLRGDSRNRINTFMNDLDEIIEDELFKGVIDIKMAKTKEWVRTDRTRALTNNQRRLGNIPKESSMKIRHCVQTDWSHEYMNNDDNRYQYQNDLTFSMKYHDPACPIIIGATKDYQGIAKFKVEPTISPDPCCFCNEVASMDIVSDPQDVDMSIKLEFDDVNDYGHDCTDQLDMVSERDFRNWPFNCQENTGIGKFYDGMCKLYADAFETDFTVVDTDVYNYILQVVFEINYFDKDKDEWIEVSEGRLVFQVSFENIAKYNWDRPTGTETGMYV